MERSEASAEGDDMESLGPGDGEYGVDYEFEEADKGSLGFVGANKVKELKRDVRKAWEGKGQGRPHRVSWQGQYQVLQERG